MDIEALKTELRDASPGDVDAVRLAALNEQERRAKVEQLPGDLAAMARDAAAAGCDPAELRARVDEALTEQPVDETIADEPDQPVET